jgi:hypothetical protein
MDAFVWLYTAGEGDPMTGEGGGFLDSFDLTATLLENCNIYTDPSLLHHSNLTQSPISYNLYNDGRSYTYPS